MRNSEVYGYIERLFDVINSGLPDGDIINETLDVLMDFEDDVHKQMQAEEQKSGFESTSFFNDLADSTYDEIIEVGKRMDEVHPKLGLFMNYLMEEDDPTFFIIYGEVRTKAVGKSSRAWLYTTIRRIFNVLLTGGSLNDK